MKISVKKMRKNLCSEIERIGFSKRREKRTNWFRALKKEYLCEYLFKKNEKKSLL